jgi:hypothetical protein
MTTSTCSGCERLIRVNASLLSDASAVLRDLDNRAYAQTAPGTNGLRIGSHLRHVIEFYECFLVGVHDGVLDYDSRKRNPVIETDRSAAIDRLHDIVQQLTALAPELSLDRSCFVLAEDAEHDEEPLGSTVGRELQILFSHTIHHLAMIAVALHAFGLRVDSAFGVALSTLRYRAGRTKAA